MYFCSIKHLLTFCWQALLPLCAFIHIPIFSNVNFVLIFAVNRLEQPAYQDHMTVVNSITGLRESRHGSRQGSRKGSRAPSRQGSLRSNRGSIKHHKNHSAAPSPSVSRRASHSNGSHAHPGKYKEQMITLNQCTVTKMTCNITPIDKTTCLNMLLFWYEYANVTNYSILKSSSPS